MKILKHKFVEHIPEDIEEETIYVSIPFETVIHKCPCGCGNEVVTPLSPTDWSLTFDGETVTLDPSIGSWSLECKSHYFIRKNEIVWSISYSNNEIKSVRQKDEFDKKAFYKTDEKEDIKKIESEFEKRKSFFSRLISKLFG